jgi:ribose/xylose/arabinose/galactoside ABC-type transport system permease subunit
MPRFQLRTEAVLLTMIVMVSAVFTFASPYFLTIPNFADLLEAYAVTTILAAGVFVVLVSGGIDISFAATASVAFFRSMGGAVGTALFGAILNTRLTHHLAEVVPASAQSQLGGAATSMNDITAIHALPEPVKTWVLTAFTQAMDDVFLIAVPFMAVAFVIALTMRERPLQGREPSAPAEVPEVSAAH